MRIGVTEGASFNPSLAAAFTAYRASYPGVQLTFSQSHSPELAANLRNNLIDVAFMCPLPDPEGLTMSRLYNEEMTLAFPIEHRFSGQTTISLNDLQDEPLLLISHGNTVHSLESELTAACEKVGFSPRIAQTVPEFMLALNLVASGVGLTFVPTYMTSIHTKRICYKRLEPAENITMETVIALRADEASTAAHNLHSLASEALHEENKTSASPICGSIKASSCALDSPKPPGQPPCNALPAQDRLYARCTKSPETQM